jgi:hypothetical protein
LLASCFFYGLNYLKMLRIGEILEVVGLDYLEVSLADRDGHIEYIDRSFLIN